MKMRGWKKIFHANGKKKKVEVTISDKVKIKVTQLYLTLCHTMDYTVHGILQARKLECLSLLHGIFPT